MRISENILVNFVHFSLLSQHLTDYRRKYKVEKTRNKFSTLSIGILQQRMSEGIICKKLKRINLTYKRHVQKTNFL